MKGKFPTMLDRPETPRIVIGLMYCFLAFFSLPFFMLLLMQGGFEDEGIISGIEIAYHVINFLVAIWIFKDYLKESFLNVQIDTKGFLKTVGTCVTLMITFAFFMFRIFLMQGNETMAMAAFGILPLAEVDLFTLSSYVIIMNPILGTLCMAVLVPFSISCLYYATSFAPVCCNRPWLAYIVVAVVIAFPRVCNALTYWLPMEELVLYLVQLPMHLLACWSYQKTDTVWAPIVVHGVTNLVISGLILLFLA